VGVCAGAVLVVAGLIFQAGRGRGRGKTLATRPAAPAAVARPEPPREVASAGGAIAAPPEEPPAPEPPAETEPIIARVPPGRTAPAHASRVPAPSQRHETTRSSSPAPDPATRLRALRRSEPRNAGHAVALAHLYFERRRFPEAISESRAAINLDGKRKSDAAIIRGAIEALGNDASDDSAASLLRACGPAAKPALQQAAKAHPNAKVRARAADLLKPSKPAKKPFLRWL
jgi:hypothetical protein